MSKLRSEISWWIPGGSVVYSGSPKTRWEWIRLTWRGYLAYWHLIFLVAIKTLQKEGAGMSEAFDPEQVERQYIDFYYGDNEEVVRAADYDKLLALYRHSEGRIRELATMFHVCDGGRYLADWQTKADMLKQP